MLFVEVVSKPKLLAVCYNRTLAPFIQEKISISYQQRTGKSLPGDAVEVMYYNGLLYRLSTKGLWRYQRIDGMGEEARVKLYLHELVLQRWVRTPIARKWLVLQGFWSISQVLIEIRKNDLSS